MSELGSQLQLFHWNHGWNMFFFLLFVPPDTDYLRYLFPQFVKSNLFHFCYTSVGQKFSICNYWNGENNSCSLSCQTWIDTGIFSGPFPLRLVSDSVRWWSIRKLHSQVFWHSGLFWSLLQTRITETSMWTAVTICLCSTARSTTQTQQVSTLLEGKTHP